MPPAMAPAVLPAPFPWRPTNRAPASGTVAERGDRHGWFMSGGRTSGPPSGEGTPRRRRGDGNGGAKRPANPPCRVLWRGPCVCTGHDSPRPQKIAPRANMGPLRAY